MSEAQRTHTPRRDDSEMLRSLIEAVTDYAIFRIDLHGRVETWNSGAERIKGYTAAEIVGQSIHNFYTSEDRRNGKPEANLRMAVENGRFEEEAWRVRRDGSQFRALVVIDPIRGPDGTIEGFAKVTRDVTAGYELERAREQLHQAQKLELVGQLTSGLAHDFNNLLGAIIGSFDLISCYTNDERITRILETGGVAASRGQRLVAQLMAFARQQELRPERCDINALITMLGELLASAVGKHITIRTEFDTSMGMTDLDPAQFQSALLNLVVNARDAMMEGGVLTLRTRRRLLEAPIAQGTHVIPAGIYTEVEVIDTGIGMAEDVRARATDPFFTTKPVGAGSGLGLSQVYGFVTQSDGLLEIDSAPGTGTVIRMLLPAKTAVAASPSPANSRRRVVLLVEDDESLRETSTQMLSALGYQVYAAEDAREALRMLERDIPIDLLFTDIVMPPGLSGDRLAERALSLRPNLAVLLTSGQPRPKGQPDDKLGADVVFLQKPYRMTTLQRTLKELLPNEPELDKAC